MTEETNNLDLTEKEIMENFDNRRWRLENLYWIKDKEGNKIKFKPNWIQEELLDSMHYLNVILKGRQMGITTFFCILYLDEALFNSMDCGLIAHRLDDAKKIFDTKIKYAWDNMHPVIKSWYDVDRQNVRELKFLTLKDDTTSSIYVGTSLRSGTYQRLHVSELSDLDLRYPDRAMEIKTGAFNTVAQGQVITVESTAQVEVGVFADLYEEATNYARSGKPLTRMNWKSFFFPWYNHPNYSLDADLVIPKEMETYFDNKEEELGIELDEGQRNWYFMKKQEQKGKMFQEYPTNPEEAFHVSTEGAYYRKQINRATRENRITTVPYEERLLVDTYWDLGTAKNRKDSMSILFLQTYGLELRIIDFEGFSGEGLPYAAKILQEKPYKYGRHFAPHDIEVKEIGSGKTRLQLAADMGIHFIPLPRVSFIEGIDTARMIFNKCYFDEKNTGTLVKALRHYRKKYDDKNQRFKDRPIKDWTSDPADAFRMMAIGQEDHRRLGDFDAAEREMARIKRGEVDGVDYDPFNPFKL